MSRTSGTALLTILTLLILSTLLLTSCNPGPHANLDFDRLLSDYSTPFRSLKHNNRIYGSGSYIKYNNKFYILTNRHICTAGQRINNNKTHIQVDNHVAKIIKISTDGDLCVLESNRQSGLLIAKKAAQPLDRLTLIGFPRGIGKVIRKGRIIGDRSILMWDGRGIVKVESTQISATAYPGNSGSPVMNTVGEVIGVLFAGSSAYPHEPFIVPHRKLIKFLDSLNSKKNDNKGAHKSPKISQRDLRDLQRAYPLDR